jgi:hypothetical protein
MRSRLLIIAALSIGLLSHARANNCNPAQEKAIQMPEKVLSSIDRKATGVGDYLRCQSLNNIQHLRLKEFIEDRSMFPSLFRFSGNSSLAFSPFKSRFQARSKYNALYLQRPGDGGTCPGMALTTVIYN